MSKHQSDRFSKFKSRKTECRNIELYIKIIQELKNNLDISKASTINFDSSKAFLKFKENHNITKPDNKI